MTTLTQEPLWQVAQGSEQTHLDSVWGCTGGKARMLFVLGEFGQKSSLVSM